MIMTSVSLSGLAEHERSGKSSAHETTAAKVRARRRTAVLSNSGIFPNALQPRDSAALRIRNLSQHRRPLRPRRRRHIRRHVDSRFQKPVPQTPPLLSPPKAVRTRRRIASQTPIGARCSASIATSVALRVPPPERIISLKEFRLAPPAFATTNRRTASAIDRAVSAVAVATMSCLRAPPHRRRKFATNSRPNSSRPAVFGGFARKNLSCRSCCEHRLDHRS